MRGKVKLKKYLLIQIVSVISSAIIIPVFCDTYSGIYHLAFNSNVTYVLLLTILKFFIWMETMIKVAENRERGRQKWMGEGE